MGSFRWSGPPPQPLPRWRSCTCRTTWCALHVLLALHLSCGIVERKLKACGLSASAVACSSPALLHALSLTSTLQAPCALQLEGRLPRGDATFKLQFPKMRIVDMSCACLAADIAAGFVYARVATGRLLLGLPICRAPVPNVAWHIDPTLVPLCVYSQQLHRRHAGFVGREQHVP